MEKLKLKLYDAPQESRASPPPSSHTQLLLEPLQPITIFDIQNLPSSKLQTQATPNHIPPLYTLCRIFLHLPSENLAVEFVP